MRVVAVMVLCTAWAWISPWHALAQSPPEAPASDEPLDGYFRALEALSGDLGSVSRIGWWGDSAIVGDGYTGELRTRLQARFGDGGPGFLLLAPPFEGYGRRGVKMVHKGWAAGSVLHGSRRVGRYGYGGVTAWSYGGAQTTYTVDDGKGIDRVMVFFHASKKTGKIQLFYDGARSPSAVLESSREKPGDHVWIPPLVKPIQSLRVRAGGGGRVMIYGVALERLGPGVVLDPVGIVGIRARRWRNADPDHMRDQIARRGLDLMVVNYGGNERVDPGLKREDHQQQIVDLIELLKQGAPWASCLVVGPMAHGHKGTTRLDPALSILYEAQREAARSQGCAFFDTLAAMGGDDAVVQFRKKRLMGADLSHLNGKGHRVVGELLATWLTQRYDGWKMTRAAQATPPPPPGSSGGTPPADQVLPP